MTSYVDRALHRNDALTGLDIEAQRFWRGCAEIFERLTLENCALLAKQDARNAGDPACKPLSADGSFGLQAACAYFLGRDATERPYRTAAARLSREGESRFSALMRARVVHPEARR